MKIYTEERSYWMGSDVAKYRRKRAVKLDWPGGPRGICHPALCFGNEPERLLMFHVRESDVQAHPRRTLFWLAWVFFRDATRICPGYMRSRLDAKAKAKAARQKLHDIMEKAENADKNLSFAELKEAWRDCADCVCCEVDKDGRCAGCFDDPGRPNWTPRKVWPEADHTGIGDALNAGAKALEQFRADAGIPSDGQEVER